MAQHIPDITNNTISTHNTTSKDSIDNTDTANRQRAMWRGTALSLGIVVLLVALFIPMDIFGMNFMFSVHMIQHLLLSLIAPPLLLLSMPPQRLQQFLNRHSGIKRGLILVTIPVVASLLFNGNIWLWHAPGLFQVMMANEPLHIITDLLYLLTGCIFWWPLLNPDQDEKRVLPLGGLLAYLFFSDMPMMLIGAGMTFSPPLYTIPMTHPTMQMLVTPQDQQLGGLLMWVASSIFLIIIASIFFLRWMLHQEKAQRALEAAEWDEYEG